MKQNGKMAKPKQVKGEKKSSKQLVYNLIILDESGSMTTIAKQAVSGLNETFQTIRNAQKEHQKQQHFISFVTFNSARINSVMNRQKVESDKKLKWTDYNPDNYTPLFDAMGQSLNELKNHVSDEDVVLVTIITDGYENASREYSGRDIKNLVAELKAKGWVFAYIGTNQDVDAVAADMGIRSRMHYEYSDLGASEMFCIERSSKRAFYDRLSRKGRQFLMEEEYDYFNPTEDDNASCQPQSNDDDKQDEEEATQQQEDTQSVDTPEEPEELKGFWEKVKKIIKG